MAELAPIHAGTDALLPSVRTLRLNRPERRNAMSVGLVDTCIAWLESARTDPDLRALVIHGAGTGFCAGSDLGGLAEMDAAARSAFEEASGRLARMLQEFPRPVIAAVHGYAIGGGLTLAAASDIVVTAPDAKWSLPEVPIGLFPAWGLEAVAARIGRPRARRLSWGIDTLDGREAVAIGLVDTLAEDPLDHALAIARKLAALPAQQAASVKDYFATGPLPEDGDREANRYFMTACATDEARASFAKFAAKTA
jgi:enoyl-CoA hydratase/carnithine racemase